MKKIIIFLVVLMSTSLANTTNQTKEIVSGESTLSVNETSKKLQDILKKKGINVFTVIEHSKEAKKVSLEMNDTKVIVFGSPKVGTPLMKCSPKFALDLPLRVLIYKDDKNKTIVSYESLKNISKKYNTDKCEKIIEKLSSVQAKFFELITK